MSAFEDFIEYTSDPYAQNLQIDVEDYEDLREHEEVYGVSIPRNVLLDRQNPLEALKEKTFRYIFKIQSNSVITNSMGPSIYVRYNRDIVITVKVYAVKCSFGTKNMDHFLFVIAANSL